MFLLSITEIAYSQSVQYELKRDLWKTIKPGSERNKYLLIPKMGTLSPVPIPTQSTAIHDVMYYYYLMKTHIVLEDFNEIYKRMNRVDPRAYTYNGAEPLTKYEPGYTQTEYIGGHFQQVSPNSNYSNTHGSATFTIDISGGGRKHLTEKTKKILREVYGQEVDDDL